jgi:class 3 adenylate cyclase/TolB-like protein/Tfp pilus assembly protein PilF
MTEKRVERRLAAILAADVAGYSRLMEADEEGTLSRLTAHRRELVDPKIAEHRGRIVKNTGDGVLVEFASVVDAVRCAVEVQRAMLHRDPELADDQCIRFRVGINLGDIIVEDGDIFGDGVNVAARLEALAQPGGACLSAAVREQVGDRLGLSFVDLGEQSVKNIERPVRVWELSPASIAATPLVPVAINAGRPVAKRQRRVTAAPPRLSIVALPLANLSADPEQEHFVDAVTDELITDLSRIEGSFVIPHATASAYKGQAVDPKELGRKLHVRYVLAGNVRWLPSRAQVSVQLSDTGTGALFWADRFDAECSDLAAAQDQIVTRLARALWLKMVEAEAHRADPNDPVAEDFVMRGWACFYRLNSEENLLDAQKNFERALQLDRRSVEAKIGLATVLGQFVANSRNHVVAGVTISAEEDLARSDQLLHEAMLQDANNPKLLYTLGHLRSLQNRHADSKILLEKAIARDRNNPYAHQVLGITLIRLGEPEAALPHIQRRMQLDPESPNVHFAIFWAGYAHLLLGRTDLAIDLFSRARAANPRYWHYQLSLAAAFALNGDLDQARTALTEALSLNPAINSIAEFRSRPAAKAGTPKYFDLVERTLMVGLRRAGLPDL